MNLRIIINTKTDYTKRKKSFNWIGHEPVSICLTGATDLKNRVADCVSRSNEIHHVLVADLKRHFGHIATC